MTGRSTADGTAVPPTTMPTTVGPVGWVRHVVVPADDDTIEGTDPNGGIDRDAERDRRD